MEPSETMGVYQSTKRVQAGEITEVVELGCYVNNEDGTSTLRKFEPGMTVRYKPVVGDYWIIYDDGYQSISPKVAFDRGYHLISGVKQGS
jgi:hypothetical protein